MTHEEILSYCLKKPGVYEDFPFGPKSTILKVRKRIFAQLFYLNDEPMLTVNGDALTNDFFRQLYPDAVKRGYHCPPVQQPYFNTINLSENVPDEEIINIIDLSYEYVKHKLPKKVQRELECE